MLKSLDILIGLAVVMLILSMVVTMLTQVVNSIVNTRGRHLRRGLADLLKQIDPDRLNADAERIAEQILTHPVIRDNSMFKWRQLGSVIQREEFTKILLELAAGDGPQGAEFRSVLSEVLKKEGITDPQSTLQNARMLALKLEASNPQLANDVRQNIALLQEASSSLTAKINAWFDQTMDRTSARFTSDTRIVTVVCSAFLALLLQVDTVGLVNRLATDDQLRAQLGKLADTVSKAEDSNRALRNLARDPEFAKVSDAEKVKLARAADPGLDKAPDADVIRRVMREVVADPSFSSASAAAQRDRIRKFRPDLAKADDAKVDAEIASVMRLEFPDRDREFLDFLSERGIVTLPKWQHAGDLLPSGKSLPGILVTALLLSLGAPFWYSSLKQLIGLRSVLAGKEDKQREERQTNQDVAPARQSANVPALAAAAGAGASGSLLTSGERGDLGALG